ncbi:PepSY-associated TM helix domain-containing protein [Sediminibacterium soli]|uniref:PepSY-associated TM helix domain-containing protein n=1 Tax=Sediminibacterium soli TaxID=2698829 RepID=UPI00137B5DAA|nr:PepSY-associated TM helix domain-containing protein [Sediminibacterium soli]NCI47975.1 peptidase [Sediminibacterium soli]
MSKSLQPPLNSGNEQTNNPHPAKVYPKKKQVTPLTGWKRQLALLSRWLHIYLSMVSFAILLFFAVTGLTLNHADKWGGETKTRTEKGRLNAQWVNRQDTNTIAKLEMVEYLRKTHRIKGAVTEFRIDDRECTVSFKGPGYSADAFVIRETGEYELNESRSGLIGIINDLHKGRDSGGAWSVIIDLSAILMTLVSLSGIILICFVRKRRFSGLVLAVMGLLLAYFIYLVWVP